FRPTMVGAASFIELLAACPKTLVIPHPVLYARRTKDMAWRLVATALAEGPEGVSIRGRLGLGSLGNSADISRIDQRRNRVTDIRGYHAHVYYDAIFRQI